MLVDAYAAAQRIAFGRDLLEAPAEWRDLVSYPEVLQGQAVAVTELQHSMTRIMLAIDPDAAERRCSSDILWQAGIPLSEPLDELYA